MRKLIFILFVTVAALYSPTVFAVEGRNGENNELNDDRVENRFEQRIERDDNRVKIRIRQENENENREEVNEDLEEKVEIKGNNFEIRGEITKIEDDSFVIASQTIFIDPKLVREFEQKGTLKVGERAKVEGIIVDGKKFAREIKVFRSNEEIQIEVKNATQAARAKVEVKARGAFEQISDLLRQIFNFLTGQRS